MDAKEFKKLYTINRKQLLGYYYRTKNRLHDKEEIEVIANFIKHQAIIELNIKEISHMLSYYDNLLKKDKNLIEFALEWIRANEIRLKYKKYLITTRYPEEDFTLAIDDCISRFFLEYYKYIGDFFSSIKEHELSTLFNVLFNRADAKIHNFDEILEWHQDKVPTIFEENIRINTNIITLRSGLSQIIIQDYQDVLTSREKEQQIKEEKKIKTFKVDVKEIDEFQGLLLERMIKTYCISKTKLSIKEIENVIAQFLTSYFKFGIFYNYEEFKDNLIHSFARDLHEGLTPAYKRKFELHELEQLITDTMDEFRAINKIKVLDGSAWKNDISKYLKKFLINFADNLFEPKSMIIKPSKFKTVTQEFTDEEEGPDFRALFDINLEIEEFRKKLEASLENSDYGFVKKQSIIRSKVQEFRMEKRRKLLKNP
ncbi:MAG: hypothetical protein ACFFD2_28280 [Promethearchaeota archaeon]